MRTAYLVRLEDVSGSSGTGIVGEIVQFTNGWCILFWLTEVTSFKFFPTIEELDHVHSHEGRTKVIWRDEIRDLQELLDEGDPLLDMLRSIQDRRVALTEQAKPPPVRKPTDTGLIPVEREFLKSLQHWCSALTKAADDLQHMVDDYDNMGGSDLVMGVQSVVGDIRNVTEHGIAPEFPNEYERVLSEQLEDLRALHHRANEPGADLQQLVFDLGSHIHELDIWFENEATQLPPEGDPVPSNNDLDSILDSLD